jgi:hypothetical protein
MSRGNSREEGGGPCLCDASEELHVVPRARGVCGGADGAEMPGIKPCERPHGKLAALRDACHELARAREVAVLVAPRGEVGLQRRPRDRHGVALRPQKEARRPPQLRVVLAARARERAPRARDAAQRRSAPDVCEVPHLAIRRRAPPPARAPRRERPCEPAPCLVRVPPRGRLARHRQRRLVRVRNAPPRVERRPRLAHRTPRRRPPDRGPPCEEPLRCSTPARRARPAEPARERALGHGRDAQAPQRRGLQRTARAERAARPKPEPPAHQRDTERSAPRLVQPRRHARLQLAGEHDAAPRARVKPPEAAALHAPQRLSLREQRAAAPPREERLARERQRKPARLGQHLRDAACPISTG